jgi:cell division protein FtsB
MNQNAKKVLKYISRSWKDEELKPNYKLRFLPPFLFELLAYLQITYLSIKASYIKVYTFTSLLDLFCVR